jgi:hypothetical protein
MAVLLLAVPLLFWIAAADPVAFAKAEAGEAGAQLLGYEASDGPLGGHARVRLRLADRPTEVVLRRPLWSRSWRSVSP